MSGGHFDYAQYNCEMIADSIDDLIRNNNSVDEFGFSYGFSEATLERFREAAHNLRRAGEMAQRVDWLVSGDDGEDSFHLRWDEEVRLPYLPSY